jgi:hypothetical protein
MNKMHHWKKPIFFLNFLKTNKKLFCFLILFPNLIFAQFLEQKEFKWPDKFINYKELPDSLKNNDAVVLKEQLTVTETYIYRRVAIKILNQKGLDAFKKIQLPENFDLTNYPNFNKQGRFKNRSIAYISNYSIIFFAARIITLNKNVVELPSEFNIDKAYWIGSNGQKINDYIYDFKINVLEVGDILEYTYRANVNFRTRQNIIYPNSFYPKLDYNLKIDWTTPYNANRKPYTIHYNYLKGINYIENLPVGSVLPNVPINYGYYKSSDYLLRQCVEDGFSYKWRFGIDTLYNHHFDNYHESIRKYIQKLKEGKTNSANDDFLNQWMDSLNNLKYISTENENSGEGYSNFLPFPGLFANNEIKERSVLKNYEDILTERKEFFYNGIIIDKRLSAVNTFDRKHVILEDTIFVIPHKNAYRYVVPRYNGLKYFPDELPFYFEGTTCMLIPCYNCVGNNIYNNMIMIYTPVSGFKENARTEAALFKVNLDSLKITAVIRETLDGQLSTILRHLYNRETIDSTISERYFKKCTEKPTASNIKIISGSASEIFPPSHSYHCTENINLITKGIIDLHDWFSFPFKKEDYQQLPTHDFYIDFQYTDVYHFMFELNKPTEIINSSELNKNLNNDYFEVISNIEKKNESDYLLNVSIKVKKNIIPEKDGQKLMEFVNMLDEINNYKLLLRTQ